LIDPLAPEGYGIVCGTGNFFPTGAGKKLDAGDIVKIQRDKSKLTFFKNGTAVGNLTCNEKEILYPTIAVYYSGQVTILRGS
jgi:fructose-1-phosphate kinase PfkB-like protein